MQPQLERHTKAGIWKPSLTAAIGTAAARQLQAGAWLTWLDAVEGDATTELLV
jgi:hypothetical protein